MPLGSRVDETGVFELDGLWPVLRRDDGGRWRLDVSRKAHELLGRRVRLVGTRVAFDLVDVDRIDVL